MNKNSTSVNLTGGAGFSFEDCIAAYFMVHLLSNSIPLESDFGVVDSIDWQVSESGWLLDDLLITCNGSADLPGRLSISVKRKKQVTSKGFPPLFVEAIWQHWWDTQTNPFVKDRDLFCLAVGELADSVESAWDKMLAQALRTSSERIIFFARHLFPLVLSFIFHFRPKVLFVFRDEFLSTADD